MIIEGTTEKVSKFFMRTKSIYKNIFVLMSTAERFEHNKIFIITSFLLNLFRAALYKLVFVLHKMCHSIKLFLYKWGKLKKLGK
jgi:hypothetical protein